MDKEKKEKITEELKKLNNACFNIEKQLKYFGICVGSEEQPTEETKVRNTLFRARILISEAYALVKVLDEENSL